jgi:hypothetical protein
VHHQRLNPLPDRLERRERYSLTPADFDLINRHRTEANRLGFAIQLCAASANE